MIQPRIHETNLRFDNANNDLRNAYRVLRLRQDEKAHLTFKGPSTEKEGGILSRQEIEFVVEDFEIAKQFLKALGFKAIVFYEKFRTTYELSEVHIMLDELPYGEFVEIEGDSVEAIRNTINLLGLNWDAAVKAGYHALFEKVAEKYNLEPSQLSFSALENTMATADDLGVQSAN